jgi:hypothetical protein
MDRPCTTRCAPVRCGTSRRTGCTASSALGPRPTTALALLAGVSELGRRGRKARARARAALVGVAPCSHASSTLAPADLAQRCHRPLPPRERYPARAPPRLRRARLRPRGLVHGGPRRRTWRPSSPPSTTPPSAPSMSACARQARPRPKKVALTACLLCTSSSSSSAPAPTPSCGSARPGPRQLRLDLQAYGSLRRPLTLSPP